MYTVYCNTSVARVRGVATSRSVACLLANHEGHTAVVCKGDFGAVEFRAAPTGGTLDATEEPPARTRPCGARQC